MSKEELLNEWLKLKKKEDRARKERQKIEIEIELMFPFSDGQSMTFNENDYKINIKKNYAYKFQTDWPDIRVSIPENLRPEKIKYDVDVKGLEYLKDNNTEIYNKISDCITMKQNKTTIKVEKKEG